MNIQEFLSQWGKELLSVVSFPILIQYLLNFRRKNKPFRDIKILKKIFDDYQSNPEKINNLSKLFKDNLVKQLNSFNCFTFDFAKFLILEKNIDYDIILQINNQLNSLFPFIKIQNNRLKEIPRNKKEDIYLILGIVCLVLLKILSNDVYFAFILWIFMVIFIFTLIAKNACYQNYLKLKQETQNLDIWIE